MRGNQIFSPDYPELIWRHSTFRSLTASSTSLDLTYFWYISRKRRDNNKSFASLVNREISHFLHLYCKGVKGEISSYPYLSRKSSDHHLLLRPLFFLSDMRVCPFIQEPTTNMYVRLHIKCRLLLSDCTQSSNWSKYFDINRLHENSSSEIRVAPCG